MNESLKTPKAAMAAEFRNVPLDGPEAVELLAEVQQYYVQVYGGPDETPMKAAEFALPTGAYLIAELDGQVAGCAGIRQHDREAAELKRLFVRADYRRRGLARQLMSAIEEQARQLGYRRLLLETGSKQPEAITLYEAIGYEKAENFGFHQHSENVRSFVKTL